MTEPAPAHAVAHLRAGDVFTADGTIPGGPYRLIAVGSLPGARKLYVDHPEAQDASGPLTRRQLSRLRHFIVGVDVPAYVHERLADDAAETAGGFAIGSNAVIVNGQS